MSVSLFASTAFAGNAPAPTQVIVANTPAQPVPMVGLVKDSRCSGSQTVSDEYKCQSCGSNSGPGDGSANQRLVIEYASGSCTGTNSGFVEMYSQAPGSVVTTAYEYLPSQILFQTISIPVKFYVNPGDQLRIALFGGVPGGLCSVTVHGYYVDLP
jgi:predicted RNA-binding Zn-ribbon protein involved in translation (DUF1610 family)